MSDRRTVTILQACSEMQVSRRTIYNWINAGKVEYMRTAGGAIRIFADTLWRRGETDGARGDRVRAGGDGDELRSQS